MSQTSIIPLYQWSKHPSYTGRSRINTESHSAGYLKGFLLSNSSPSRQGSFSRSLKLYIKGCSMY